MHDTQELLKLLDHFAGIALKSFIDLEIDEVNERVLKDDDMEIGDFSDVWAGMSYEVAISMVTHRENALKKAIELLEFEKLDLEEQINIINDDIAKSAKKGGAA